MTRKLQGSEGLEELSSLEVGEGGEVERIVGMVSDEVLDDLGLGGETREEGSGDGDAQLEDEGLDSPKAVVETTKTGPRVVSLLSKTCCTLLSPVGIVKE